MNGCSPKTSIYNPAMMFALRVMFVVPIIPVVGTPDSIKALDVARALSKNVELSDSKKKGHDKPNPKPQPSEYPSLRSCPSEISGRLERQFGAGNPVPRYDVPSVLLSHHEYPEFSPVQQTVEPWEVLNVLAELESVVRIHGPPSRKCIFLTMR